MRVDGGRDSAPAGPPKALDGEEHPADKGRPASVVEEDLSALGIYFRQMGAVDLMTPDEERAAAKRIITHREAYWRAIFRYPPFVDGIVKLVEEVCDDERRPQAALDELRRCSRKVRDRETRANKEAFDLSVAEAAAGLAMADPDGDAAQAIAHDLEAILEGQREGLKLEVTLPRQDSAPYRRYVESVREEAMALWREKLFAWMLRNAATAMEFFRLPTNRVVELGSQVEI